MMKNHNCRDTYKIWGNNAHNHYDNTRVTTFVHTLIRIRIPINHYVNRMINIFLHTLICIRMMRCCHFDVGHSIISTIYYHTNTNITSHKGGFYNCRNNSNMPYDSCIQLLFHTYNQKTCIIEKEGKVKQINILSFQLVNHYVVNNTTPF